MCTSFCSHSSEVFLLLKVCMGTMVSQLLRHHGRVISVIQRLHQQSPAGSLMNPGGADVAEPRCDGHGLLCWFHQCPVAQCATCRDGSRGWRNPPAECFFSVEVINVLKHSGLHRKKQVPGTIGVLPKSFGVWSPVTLSKHVVVPVSFHQDIHWALFLSLDKCQNIAQY